MWQIESGKIEQIRFTERIFVLTAVVIVSFLFIYGRLFQLQIIKERHFKKISNANCVQVIFQQAPRGTILDNQGNVLVDNTDIFSLFFSPFNLSNDDIKKSIDKINEISGADKGYLTQKIEAQRLQPFTFERLIKGISKKNMFCFEEQKQDIPGVNIQTETIRNYVNGNFASHVLGYIGEVNRSELRELGNEYKMGDMLGKNGIEKIYDDELQGTEGGKQIEVDAFGRQLRVIREIAPLRGDTLVLTINQGLQKIAEEAMGNLHGCVIILNPENGEILSLVSKPSFDPNIFTKSLTKQEADFIFKSTSFPLMNRAIQAQYAPGSIFKIIVAIAALENEKININDTFECKGSFIWGKENRVFKCWKKEGHGVENLMGAMADSCDVYFYNLGLKTGVQNIAEYAKKFGLGENTGINLLSEKKGIVPTPEWKKEKRGFSWYDGDTINLSIGQGYLWSTPLQIANMLSCVVNGGKLYRPYIVKKVMDTNNNLINEIKPYKIRDVKMSDKTVEIIKKSLKNTVENGTGRGVYLKGLSIGGKTGTAQNPQGEDHAWFVCFLPVESPKMVICVLVEHGGSGGSVAAPIAREIIEKAMFF